MNEKEREKRKVLRAKPDPADESKTLYICRVCNKDLTEAVSIFNRETAENTHRVLHYFQARDRVLKYAERCFKFTKDNKGVADMTAYMLLIGAVKSMHNLDSE